MQRTRGTYALILTLTVGLLAFSFITSAGDLGSFGTTLLSGLFLGALYFLVASGLSIIFGLMDILNFAQGAYFMVGAYVTYSLFHLEAFQGIDVNLRFPLGVVVGTIIGGVLGVVLERGLLRPLYARPIFQLVLTFGVAIVFGEGLKAIWGTEGYSWSTVTSFGIHQSQFEIFGRQFGAYRLFVVAVGVVLIVLIGLLLQRTRIGIIIRAGVEDSEMVEALGINVRAVFTMVFTLGCAVAAFGGAIAAPFLGANLGMGNAFLLPGIAVVVLGGLGSYMGTAVGSFMVGLAVAVVARFASEFLNQTVWASITPMLLLILILLLRPSGLFGKESR
ncbi:MAG: branched-chain amino acid ABC transporter permease [Chloroflexi bacterium]|nr:branched-chain amino acid ABC transporter permease [Chloroflexota bacterium]